MRKKLRDFRGKRTRFRAVFERYGSKRGWVRDSEPTILLRDVVCVHTGTLVANHLWFNLTKGFRSLGHLSPGDVIEFDARAKSYQKGYVNFREGIDLRHHDYKLTHPTRIVKAGESVREENGVGQEAPVSS